MPCVLSLIQEYRLQAHETGLLVPTGDFAVWLAAFESSKRSKVDSSRKWSFERFVDLLLFLEARLVQRARRDCGLGRLAELGQLVRGGLRGHLEQYTSRPRLQRETMRVGACCVGGGGQKREHTWARYGSRFGYCMRQRRRRSRPVFRHSIHLLSVSSRGCHSLTP